MKPYILLGLPLFGIACGTPAPVSVSKRQFAASELSKKAAVLVNNVGELPICTVDRVNELIFVKDMDLFKVCKNETWSDVDATRSSLDAEAVLVTEIMQISASDQDLCAGDSGASCKFEGGELIRYSDFSIKYNVSVVKRMQMAPIENSDEKIDTQDISNGTMVHLASWPTSQLKILSDITRHGVTSNVWIHLDANDKALTVFFDSNHDDSLSKGDEVLFNPGLISL